METGCFHGVLGANGSGKTTLLDLISGFLKPDIGHIDIDQAPVQSLSKKEISKKDQKTIRHLAALKQCAERLNSHKETLKALESLLINGQQLKV